MAEGGVYRQLLATFTFDVDSRAAEKKTNTFFKTIRQGFTAFAAVMAVNKLKGFIEHTVEGMQQVSRAAAEIKISTDRVQEFQAAAKSLGIPLNVLSLSMERLEISLGLAERGSGRQVAALKALGIASAAAYVKSKPMDEVFTDIAERIAKIEDPTKRAAATLDLFGRGGHRLLPFLTLGGHGIANLIKQFRELNGGYTKKAIAQANELGLAHTKLHFVNERLISYLFSQAEPTLKRWTERGIKATQWMIELTKRSTLGEAAVKVFTLAIVGLGVALAVMFPTATAVTVGIVALIAALDDLQVAYRGGDSELGALFGRGETAKFLHEVVDAWMDIATYAGKAWESIKKVFKAMGLTTGDEPNLELDTVDLAPEWKGPTGSLREKKAAAPWWALGGLTNFLPTPDENGNLPWLDTPGGFKAGSKRAGQEQRSEDSGGIGGSPVIHINNMTISGNSAEEIKRHVVDGLSVVVKSAASSQKRKGKK